jgi:hypothetical protein
LIKCELLKVEQSLLKEELFQHGLTRALQPLSQQTRAATPPLAEQPQEALNKSVHDASMLGDQPYRAGFKYGFICEIIEQKSGQGAHRERGEG